MKIFFAILLIGLCNFDLFAQSNFTKEDYAVYASVFEEIYLNAQFYKGDKYKPPFVILNNTIEPNYEVFENNLKNNRVTDSWYKTYIKNPPSGLTPIVFEAMLREFKESNNSPSKIKKQFPIEYEYNIVTKSEIDKLLDAGKVEYEELKKKNKEQIFGNGFRFVWQPFYRKYQNSQGYYSLSKIGFSAEKKIALAYAKLESGGSGTSQFYILEKVDDTWKVRTNFGSFFIID